ncbi:TetR/AcrR family transcriptional regulator [Streptomyces sp. NPDC059455]|uniref:TetR/AcrR family transcriptional regulator n=1 Tax=Streptomyces sp. NPDC059455 TaxID=3346837 RepID=UPI003673B792
MAELLARGVAVWTQGTRSVNNDVALVHEQALLDMAAGQRSGTSRREPVENEILEHVTRLFVERGFAGTSLQDLAAAMSLTRPALYYYVKSKDELLAKLVEEVVQAPAAALQEIGSREDLDAADKLRMLVRTVATRIAAHATASGCSSSPRRSCPLTSPRPTPMHGTRYSMRW